VMLAPLGARQRFGLDSLRSMSWSYRTPARTLLDSLKNSKKLKICILGAVAGHDVTLVARGARLDKLTRDGGVIATSPPTTPTPARVTVATAVDPSCAWDLVLVTVLAHQLDAALLGVLKSCPDSTTVMFMFNTFAALDEYRNAVGASR